MTDDEPTQNEPANDECILCGTPGGHPYCNDDCRLADQCECDDLNTCTC